MKSRSSCVSKWRTQRRPTSTLKLLRWSSRSMYLTKNSPKPSISSRQLLKALSSMEITSLKSRSSKLSLASGSSWLPTSLRTSSLSEGRMYMPAIYRLGLLQKGAARTGSQETKRRSKAWVWQARHARANASRGYPTKRNRGREKVSKGGGGQRPLQQNGLKRPVY